MLFAYYFEPFNDDYEYSIIQENINTNYITENASFGGSTRRWFSHNALWMNKILLMHTEEQFCNHNNIVIKYAKPSLHLWYRIQLYSHFFAILNLESFSFWIFSETVEFSFRNGTEFSAYLLVKPNFQITWRTKALNLFSLTKFNLSWLRWTEISGCKMSLDWVATRMKIRTWKSVVLPPLVRLWAPRC